jgi:chemotaxis protein MotB
MARKPKKGLPPWMATFADLSTLLLTFFVLLLTFANLDLKKFYDMLGSVQKAFGVEVRQRGEYQPVKPKVVVRTRTVFRPSRIVTPSQQSIQSAEMARQIKKLVEASGLGRAVEITSGSRGVRMRVKGHLLFEPGQAEIKRSAARLLNSVAAVMRKYKFYLTVEGHTDNQPIRTARFPSNWELSAARAAAVLRYLVKKGVPAARVSAVGYADNYPIASNATEAGRRKNRRVEFVFTREPLRQSVD